MPKQNRKHSNRIKNLIVIFSLTAVILSVSTYAWFIGMRTVNVSSFDVEIAGTDSLLLSLNGSQWDTTVSISQESLSDKSYSGNTNNWGGRGLIPVSSVGDMDTAASRMKLFEKASLTASKGGYRLLASRVDNYENVEEQDGYVVFDLFVKNFSGTQYIIPLNEADEEAIYLTTNSSVNVDVDGGGVADTGIENSVRVAFAQIGRVAGTTTDPAKITGITCNADEEGNPAVVGDVTGICRTAQIWEPNDTKHVQNAISWYETSCTSRSNTDGSYALRTADNHDCGSVINGTAYPTYAIKTAITSENNVDIYDGLKYNGYTKSEEKGYLYNYEYFTDSKKVQTGTSRQDFMTLAPNSITKVRVYVYIEGQDVDNYDFASIGKKISINFGFTKERYTDEDIDYEGPDLPIQDENVPVITLKGDSEVRLNVGDSYTDAGATASDVQDLDLTSEIETINKVDTSKAGTYYVTYKVTDKTGNTTQISRKVIVE